jgi:hypothetical protein
MKTLEGISIGQVVTAKYMTEVYDYRKTGRITGPVTELCKTYNKAKVSGKWVYIADICHMEKKEMSKIKVGDRVKNVSPASSNYGRQGVVKNVSVSAITVRYDGFWYDSKTKASCLQVVTANEKESVTSKESKKLRPYLFNTDGLSNPDADDFDGQESCLAYSLEHCVKQLDEEGVPVGDLSIMDPEGDIYTFKWQAVKVS